MDRVDQMYEAIKQKIMNLEVDPSQPIDETALVRATGDSAVIVQQALDRLTRDGIVEKRRGRRYVTRQATAATMHEIFEVRLTLEGLCARLAAERVTADQIAQMEQLIQQFERVLQQGDNAALLAVDRKFHQQLYQASGNRFLAKAVDEMYLLVYRLSFFALDRMGSVRTNVEEHREILAAIKAGDGRAAERHVEDHIRQFQRMVDQFL
jgi:DNA-binding GntR family transcriptional regulator